MSLEINIKKEMNEKISFESAEKFRKLTNNLHLPGMKIKAREYFESLGSEEQKYIKNEPKYNWLVKAVYMRG